MTAYEFDLPVWVLCIVAAATIGLVAVHLKNRLHRYQDRAGTRTVPANLKRGALLTIGLAFLWVVMLLIYPPGEVTPAARTVERLLLLASILNALPYILAGFQSYCRPPGDRLARGKSNGIPHGEAAALPFHEGPHQRPEKRH